MIGTLGLAKRLSFAPELVDLLRDSVHMLGCDVGYFTVASSESGRTVQRVILACDPAWAIEYGERGCFRADPWLRYASSHSAPCSAADVPVLTAEEEATVRLAGRFGFDHAALIPAPAPEGQARIGLLVIGARDDVSHLLLTRPERALARELAMTLHERWVTGPRDPTHGDLMLTPLDARVLELELQGLGTKAIARQLATTSTSIDSRFQRLNRRLCVKSRRQAALLCLDYGLIKPGSAK